MEPDAESSGPAAAPEAGDSSAPVVFRRTVLLPGHDDSPASPEQAAPHFARAAPAPPSDTRQFAGMSASVPGPPPGDHGNDAVGGGGPGGRRRWQLVAVFAAVVLAAVAAIPLVHQLRSSPATTNQAGDASALSASAAAVPAKAGRAPAGGVATPSTPSAQAATSGAATPSSAAAKLTKPATQGATGTKPAKPAVTPTSAGPAPLLDIYLGRGCTQTSTHGFYTHAESSSDWTVGTSGGYAGNGCTDRYDSFALFETSAWGERYLEWWIADPSLGDATCNVWVYIPKASSAADTAGSATFAVIPAKLSFDTLGRFVVDESAKKGGWAFGGSYAMTSGNIAVKLLGIGTGRAAGSAAHVLCWT